MNRFRTVAITGAASAVLLTVGFVVRVIQDLPVVRDAFTSSDSLAAALLLIEAVVLGVVAILAVGSGVVAWRNWVGRARSRLPGVIVFALIALGGFFFAAQGFGWVRVAGWTSIVLAGAGLIAQTSTAQD